MPVAKLCFEFLRFTVLTGLALLCCLQACVSFMFAGDIQIRCFLHLVAFFPAAPGAILALLGNPSLRMK
jgi:hypothetical protein